MSAITLTHADVTLTLSERLHWSDEFDWHPVEQASAYSTTGALLIDVATREAGRPITLQGVPSEAWMPRSDMQQLAAWAAMAGAQFTLVLRGQARRVVFDHAQGALQAEPIWLLLDGEISPELLYRPTLRFLEIAEE